VRGVLKNIKKFFKRDRLDILMVHFSDPRSDPPEINAYKILTKNGYSVEEICIRARNIPLVEEKGRFIMIGERRGPRFNYILYPWFALYTICYLIFKRPKVIIAYETFAFMPAFIVSIILQKPLIYHIHDMVTKEKLGLSGSLLYSFELKFVKYVAVLSMPDKNRMEIYLEECKISKQPLIINNAAPINLLSPSPKPIKEWLKSKGYRLSYVIFRHGGMGDDQSIIEAILSLKYLPSNVGLVLTGYSSDEFLKRINKTIDKNKLKDRVVILGMILWERLISFLPTVDVGLGIVKPTNSINKRFYGPGSNKISEFIAAGIPVIVNSTKEMHELNKKIGSFVFADPYSPKSIARAIKEVIDNPEKAKRLRENAKRAFETFYNFEYQFKPVLKEIKKWVKR